MSKLLHSQSVKTALDNLGWTQKRLADEIGVTSQAVTNWLKGVDFPRPDKLLKLATTLKLGFDALVESEASKPVIAFRKKAGAKTTDEHIRRAEVMGALLKPLVSYLPPRKALRTQIPSPTTDYQTLQNAVAAVREKIGIGMQAALTYQQLIGEFRANDAVIVPIMWGQKRNHENALHILLPDEQVTFVYLNLDTHQEDFKFWMAHELAHVYTPEIAGKNEGEDFADAFAGALLFPRELAHTAYAEAVKQRAKTSQTEVLRRIAAHHHISLFSVFCEVRKYAQATGVAPLKVQESDIHALRSMTRGALISESLFKPLPPDPKALIAASSTIFLSDFFPSLQKMLHERETGAGYIQQVLNVSIHDAAALHAELAR
jgi:transcriptional regulator with XRE-family HTH domain